MKKLIDLLKEEDPTRPGILNPNRPKNKGLQKQFQAAHKLDKQQSAYNKIGQRSGLTQQDILSLITPQNFQVITEPRGSTVYLIVNDNNMINKLKQSNLDVEKLAQTLERQFPQQMQAGIKQAMQNFGQPNEKSIFGGVHLGPIQSQQQDIQQMNQQMPSIRKAQQANFQRHGAENPFAEFEQDDEEIQESLSIKNYFGE